MKLIHLNDWLVNLDQVVSVRRIETLQIEVLPGCPESVIGHWIDFQPYNNDFEPFWNYVLGEEGFFQINRVTLINLRHVTFVRLGDAKVVVETVTGSRFFSNDYFRDKVWDQLKNLSVASFELKR